MSECLRQAVTEYGGFELSETGICALRVQFYRGIGSSGVELIDFSRLNVFIGPNNAGKSTILRFLAEDAPWYGGQTGNDPTQNYRGKVTGKLVAAIGVSRMALYGALVEIGNRGAFRGEVGAFAQKVLSAIKNEAFWYSIDARGSLVRGPNQIEFLSPLDSSLNQVNLRDFFRQVSGAVDRDLGRYFASLVTQCLEHCKPAIPKAVLVPAIRSVGKRGEALKDFSGAGLIDRLAQLQAPDHVDWQAENEVFLKINRLVQFVLNRPDARIEIPHHLEHINLHIDNKVLPLSSLGTGVQQLILIGAFCCMNDDGIICLEEPETHLHPAMQRKLFDFLMRETSAQYFVATHSATIIDLPDATVFHVENDGDQTQISLAAAANEKFNACHNLGYRASDIAQANYVLWVEGPSDRVYFKNWLKKIDPELREGLHYTVMFYGGRLLSHLSVDDEEVVGFINLLTLGRKAGIVIDSDKKASTSPVNATKKRLITEFDEIGGFSLLTDGKEIENYLPYERFNAVVKDRHPSVKLTKPANERFGDYFAKQQPKSSKTQKPEKAKVDKVRIAEALEDVDISDLKYDLSDKLDELARAIRVANGLD